MPKGIRKLLDDIDEVLLLAFIDNPYECPILIDEKGIIRYMSRYNSKVYGMRPEEAVGKHIKEVVKTSRLDTVLRTGKAEIGKEFYVGGRKRIIARLPLRDAEGRVVGGVAKLMFHHAEKISELYHRMEILEEHLKYYQSEIASLKRVAYGMGRLIGESKPMREVKKLVLQAAASDASVLITGESGTGKELLAETIHQKSNRAAGPLIKVNCAAIPHDLIESELFGYEGGSFTGARERGKPGKFELANGGTIFLDEIGDMPLRMQAKLLRVIQEYEIERIGGTKPVKLDFRVIAATNRDIEKMIKNGSFRIDLYYRINVFEINAPSLRDMVEDIPRIAYHFLSIYREKRPQSPKRISDEAMELLKRYSWPGNVRELRNIIERAMTVAEGNEITVKDLPKRIREFYREGYDNMHVTGPLREMLMDAERRIICEALRMADGNKSKAARILGIHRTGLYQKMKRYGLSV
ncbi:MAG: sigma 54-interacting transcriptional regulator [Deltaproteobacteria bacterium]|nr:sigma 54-interacting transcriptional regulator [Deltaproteobacteria bacterium]MBW2120216.1 sigma 54-interacting transcriptional regulator [Deltaproteobacteria bacterium]